MDTTSTDAQIDPSTLPSSNPVVPETATPQDTPAEPSSNPIESNDAQVAPGVPDSQTPSDEATAGDEAQEQSIVETESTGGVQAPETPVEVAPVVETPVTPIVETPPVPEVPAPAFQEPITQPAQPDPQPEVGEAPAETPVVASAETSTGNTGDTAPSSAPVEEQPVSAVVAQPTITIPDPDGGPDIQYRAVTSGTITLSPEPEPQIAAVPTIKVGDVPKIINIPQPITIAAGSLSGIPEVDEIILNVPPAPKAIFARLMDYTKKMAPRNPISAEEGTRLQKSLYQTVTNLINREEEHFQPLFTGLLKFMDKHAGDGGKTPGAFDDLHLFRYLDNVALDENDQKGFRFLLLTLRNLANPQTRATVLRTTDVNKAFRFGVTERGRAKLINYFNL